VKAIGPEKKNRTRALGLGSSIPNRAAPDPPPSRRRILRRASSGFSAQPPSGFSAQPPSGSSLLLGPHPHGAPSRPTHRHELTVPDGIDLLVPAATSSPYLTRLICSSPPPRARRRHRHTHHPRRHRSVWSVGYSNGQEVDEST